MARRSVKFNSFEELPVVLDAPLVSQILGLSLPLVYRLFSSEGFPVIHLSEKRRVVTKSAFIFWLDSKSQKELTETRDNLQDRGVG